jgi:hypothetical protein
VRTKRWLLEDNSPRQFGRLYDCGTCRDGSSYQDVTDSDAPEVLQAKILMENIVAGKPVPEVADEEPAKAKQKKGNRPGNRRKRP